MGTVKIKWTDPPDILTNEPVPCTWAGTVVVRKEGSPPRHRWDGVLIVDSTTRDEYSVDALVDDTVEENKTYYYGIFPYDTKGDYRFTKVVAISSQPIPAPEIVSLVVNGTAITVNYSVADRYTYDYITLVYKKNSAPADKTDGTAVSLSASDTSVTLSGFDINSTYYFKIFAQVTGQSEELESNIESISAAPESYRCIASLSVDGVDYGLLQIDDFTKIPSTIKEATSIVSQRIYGRTGTAPSFVTAYGDTLYHQTLTNQAAAKRVAFTGEYVEIDCPTGIIHDAYQGDVNGIKIITPTYSPYIGASYSYLNQYGGYIDYYLSIILEDTYHRGYILIGSYVSANPDYGYALWCIGGVVNGTDYIYETFKDM